MNKRSGLGYMILGISALAGLVAVLAIAQQEKSENAAVRQSTYAALREAPAKAQAKKNPLEGDSQAAAVGAKLFEQHCAECHGRSGEGTRKAPTLVHDAIRQATPGTLYWVITNGVVRQGMPVWSKLPESQRWQLVSYLQTLNGQPGPGR